jgi:AraC-like DNA-binding protein
MTSIGWVFTHEDGEPLSPSYLTHKFNDLVEETGLPPVRLHDLRHGAATLMLLAGEELKTITDQLGHSSVVLTADTYLSVAIELGLKAAAAAARLVLNAGKSPPGGGSARRRSAPVRRDHRLTNRHPGNALTTARGPTLPKSTRGPGQRQPGAPAGPSACQQGETQE